MTCSEAAAIGERLLAIASKIVRNEDTAEDYHEFALLYGPLRKAVEIFIPSRPIRAEGAFGPGTESLHNNYIEAGFMSGTGVLEMQGHAELLQLVGILRRAAATTPNADVVAGGAPMVNSERLGEIRALPSSKFDFSRLAKLCEELNTAFQNRCYLATAALTRMILNHVPPVFGQPNFESVASQHDGASFKSSMSNLQNSARKIADRYLHGPIRPTESLPNDTQVDCHADLDVLLEEVVRLSR